MDDRAVTRFLALQEHVVSRAQVLARGGNDNDIARMLRRREWSQVHPGVYVDHTGPLTRGQREWAAVLYCAPAALTGRSALRRYGVRTGRDLEPTQADGVVHLAIDRERRVGNRDGIVLRRTQRFNADVLENYSPPRMRLEHAVLDVAADSPDPSGAVAVICDAVRSRRTTADRLLGALESRSRVRHRSLLREILADAASGAHSVLEREYLTRVERPHGLPTAHRQRRVRLGRAPAYRDVEYLPYATIVELDGRLGHELTLDRWDDLERDIHALSAGSLTLRPGWAHVLEPCRLASGVARILIIQGWGGPARACSPTCPVASISGAQPAPDAGRTPRIR